MCDSETENANSEVKVNPHIGKFVESSENDFGVGKITNSNRVSATVEYFDSPADRVIRDAELMASLANGGHRARMRHRKHFAPLQESQEEACMKSCGPGERRRPDFTVHPYKRLIL